MTTTTHTAASCAMSDMLAAHVARVRALPVVARRARRVRLYAAHARLCRIVHARINRAV